MRRILDRYVIGTNLQLRQQSHADGISVYKFTQKLKQPDGRFQQGYITNMYITKTEYELLAQLPARTLAKTRFSVPPFGI
jgi:hypothetical protein